MESFGLIVKFATQPGQRDALVELLLEAAEAMKSVDGCAVYIVNVSDEQPDAVWVTETWTDAAAHEASLAFKDAQSLIQRARPLIAGVEQVRLQPVGGKGL